MTISLKKILRRTGKIIGLILLFLILLIALIPVLFSDTIEKEIKVLVNEKIDGEVNFSKARLSFFTHFPSLTLSLYDLHLRGSAPFQKDTLLKAREIGFGIDLSELLFHSHVLVDQLFIEQATIHVLVSEKGEANYNVFNSTDSSTNQMQEDSSDVSLQLEKMNIGNSALIYNDLSLGLFMQAEGLSYKGKGDLLKQRFNLQSDLSVNSFDLTFDKEPYLKGKKIKANLITKINTRSLSVLFEQNKLYLNQLPVDFTGSMDFLDNGYDLNFKMTSVDSDLEDLLSALPPQYLDWQTKTKIEGKSDFLFSLKGPYIPAEDKSPDIQMDLRIRNGLVQHEGAPQPVSNLFLNFSTTIPSLNPDLLECNIDTLSFKMGKDYATANFWVKGLEQPTLKTKVDMQLDIEPFAKALGIEGVDVKGRCSLALKAEGQYKTGPDPKNQTKKQDTVVLSIPAFELNMMLKDGYVKHDSLPHAIEKIQLQLMASCKTSDYRNTSMDVSQFSAEAFNSYLRGNVKVMNLNKVPVEANVDANIDLSEIGKYLPVDDLQLSGQLKTNIKAKGFLDPEKNIYPAVIGKLNLDKGLLQTGYYPQAIKDITIRASAENKKGTLKDQKLDISTLSFVFENKPMLITASFQNAEDALYDIHLKGELDLGKIHQVFSTSVPEVTGSLKANLELKGRQSDLMAERYEKLNQGGTLLVKNLTLKTDYLPLLFEIRNGAFRFEQDKVWLESFSAVYGKTDMQLSGYLENVIPYVLTEDAVLAGTFDLRSSQFYIDEWISPADTTSSSLPKTSTATQEGVVVIPPNLNLNIKAVAQKIVMDETTIRNMKGELQIIDGRLHLKESGFEIAGASTSFNASYFNKGTKSAFFDFKVQAKDFDVRKMYDSVPLFREMATAAGKAQGIVSLDYQLKGRLDLSMQPVYPSLEGKGVLSVKNVKVKGLRLFNAVSKTTGNDTLASPDIRKVDFKTSIKNNIITLERVKIKMAGFRLRMEGQSSFDGNIKFRMRLGLPPLGIIGIPLTFTGTQEKPKIKVGKRDKESLSGQEDMEEE